jgi:hypothetical protein
VLAAIKINHHHNRSQLQLMVQYLCKDKNDYRHAHSLTHHSHIVKTANEYFSLKESSEEKGKAKIFIPKLKIKP